MEFKWLETALAKKRRPKKPIDYVLMTDQIIGYVPEEFWPLYSLIQYLKSEEQIYSARAVLAENVATRQALQYKAIIAKSEEIMVAQLFWYSIQRHYEDLPAVFYSKLEVRRGWAIVITGVLPDNGQFSYEGEPEKDAKVM